MEQNKNHSKKLYRSSENRFIFGVCGGLGEYFGIDPLIFRIIFVGLTVSAGSGILIYLLMAVLIPKRSLETLETDDKRTKSENAKERINNLVSEAKSIFNSETSDKGDENKKNSCCERGFWRSFFGWTILIVGAILLAQKVGFLSDFNFIVHRILRLWPFVLVFIGLSILSRGLRMGRILSVIIVLFLIFWAMGFFTWSGDPAEMHSTPFNISANETTTMTEATLEAGAADIKIIGDGNAFSGEFVSVGGLKTESTVSEDGKTQKVLIKTIDRRMMWHGWKNSLNVKIAEDRPVDLKIKTGASKLNLDASSIAMNSLSVDAGASKLKIVFGEKSDNVAVDIRAGASAIDLILPKNVGARIETKGGLLDREFVGFSKKEGGLYESENYSGSDKKINIKIDAGVSKISVSFQ